MRKLTNLRDVISLNSTLTLARVHKSDFVNDQIFVEHVAEDVGVYGKVVDYYIKDNGHYVDIYLSHL